jgi:3-oxoacyl-[acyl-carrier protein] reductase
MGDKILEFVHSPTGHAIASALGLPIPPRLSRDSMPYTRDALSGVNVLVGAFDASPACVALVQALHGMGASLKVAVNLAGLTGVKQVAMRCHVEVGVSLADSGGLNSAYVLDVTGATRVAHLRLLHDFFSPHLRAMPKNSRVVLISNVLDDGEDVEQAAVQGALTGFVRSLAKEAGKNGTSVNLIQLKAGAQDCLDGVLRFFLSDHSTFVSGQVLPVFGPVRGVSATAFCEKPLTGKVAVVTGAARGIGASIAQVLAREGAKVIGVDRPQDESTLGATMSDIGGVVCPLDMTDANAGKAIAVVAQEACQSGIDILIHNAGITRDKMLRNMKADLWDSVMDVNLDAIVRCNAQLLEQNGLAANARLVCISSLGGIAGNAGQTNYASTKAGIIAYVASMAKLLGERGIAINAVAPGFIETQMTAAMPALTRQVARRVSSFMQGGLPVDIAEAVAFMASPMASGVNGATLRVCGQNLLGA